MRCLLLISGVSILSIMVACTGKNKYQGDSMVNYPDLTLIQKEYLSPYEKSPNTFLKVEFKNNQKDSSYLKAEQVNWKEINDLFAKANLYQKQLDKQYLITVISDTLSPTMTLLYSSLNPQNYIRKLSINAESTDNKILSIYWETQDEGFYSSEEKKILYVVGKTLQIQQFNKKVLASGKKKIIQYVFLN